MTEGWKFEMEHLHAREVSQKSRHQTDVHIHKMWLSDFLVHFKKRVLLINDFCMGTGSCSLAAVSAKVSPEAAAANARVCTFSTDPRPIFFTLVRL